MFSQSLIIYFDDGWDVYGTRMDKVILTKFNIILRKLAIKRDYSY